MIFIFRQNLKLQFVFIYVLQKGVHAYSAWGRASHSGPKAYGNILYHTPSPAKDCSISVMGGNGLG